MTAKPCCAVSVVLSKSTFESTSSSILQTPFSLVYLRHVSSRCASFKTGGSKADRKHVTSRVTPMQSEACIQHYLYRFCIAT